ncbi:hypothetical protein GEV33_013798 [Tenebrio molitor]|uniref:RRM domain-containing protein n=1 Tax=Tenebrio molitor TaxID=7067 RepID=A0A8J6H6K0_TENMO|nr:hypothetical protein GEV33_013798 [Tenebrio molitor]
MQIFNDRLEIFAVWPSTPEFSPLNDEGWKFYVNGKLAQKAPDDFCSIKGTAGTLCGPLDGKENTPEAERGSSLAMNNNNNSSTNNNNNNNSNSNNNNLLSSSQQNNVKIEQEQPDSDTIKMFVGQVPRSMDENDLRRMFEEYGRVHSINVLRDKTTGASKVPEKINYHRGDSDLNLQLLRNRSERVREGNSVFSERRNLHDQFSRRFNLCNLLFVESVISHHRTEIMNSGEVSSCLKGDNGPDDFYRNEWPRQRRTGDKEKHRRGSFRVGGGIPMVNVWGGRNSVGALPKPARSRVRNYRKPGPGNASTSSGESLDQGRRQERRGSFRTSTASSLIAKFLPFPPDQLYFAAPRARTGEESSMRPLTPELGSSLKGDFAV